MYAKRILWCFPLCTQIIFSLSIPFWGTFNLENLGYVFLFSALPTFLLAIICVYYQFYRHNALQIALWSGIIHFFNSLILFSIFVALSPTSTPISLWEHTLAIFYYALMFSLPSMIYAMIILRLFLPTYRTS